MCCTSWCVTHQSILSTLRVPDTVLGFENAWTRHSAALTEVSSSSQKTRKVKQPSMARKVAEVPCAGWEGALRAAWCGPVHTGSQVSGTEHAESTVWSDIEATAFSKLGNFPLILLSLGMEAWLSPSWVSLFCGFLTLIIKFVRKFEKHR